MRALSVYLWVSSPAEKGERGCAGQVQTGLVKWQQDHQVVVGWGSGVQRHRPVEREYLRAVFCWTEAEQALQSRLLSNSECFHR